MIDSLQWLFLESAAALGAICFLSVFFLLVRWRRGGSRRQFLIGLAAGIALMILQAAVVTPRERAAQIMTHVENAVVNSRVDLLAAKLSPNYAAGESGQFDRDTFVDLVRQALRNVRVRSAKRGRLEIVDKNEGGFTAVIGYLSELRGSGFAGPCQSRWRVTFTREESGWLITSIDPVMLNRQPFTSWERLLSRLD